MKLDIDAIKQFSQIRKRLTDSGVIYADILSDKVMVELWTLLDAPKIKIEERDTETYPYEVYCKLDGVEVYAITDERELKSFLERRGKGETVRVNG